MSVRLTTVLLTRAMLFVRVLSWILYFIGCLYYFSIVRNNKTWLSQTQDLCVKVMSADTVPEWWAGPSAAAGWVEPVVAAAEGVGGCGSPAAAALRRQRWGKVSGQG